MVKEILSLIADNKLQDLIDFIEDSQVIYDDGFLEALSNQVATRSILKHIDDDEIIRYIKENVNLDDYNLKIRGIR
jgi:hypothetical protein